MKKTFLIFIILIFFTNYGTAQIFDKYGLNIGTSYFNQLWNYKLITVDNSNKDYKLGMSAFFSAEKKINRLFSIRPEIGYIQKGFKNNLNFTLADGTSAGSTKGNVIFNDLGLNIGLKTTPFSSKFNPYVLLGIRGNYMFSYKDVIFEEKGSGLKFNMYKSQIDEFNKFNLDGLIGIGLEINDLTYLEFEYNPAILSSFNDSGLEIMDNGWIFKLGINLNKMKK